MLLSPIRCCGPAAGHSIKRSVQAATNNPSFTKFVFGRRSYAKESKGSNCSSCCKEVDQTKGRKMEKWPKSETSPPGWRSQCPKDPQPINYDPYRIKVPEIAVPPLPPSNCKELPNEDSQVFRNPGNSNVENQPKDMFHDSPIIHPNYWKEKPEPTKKISVQGVLPKLGYHGRNKYKFAFHEPWRPLDRMALLEQAEKEELDKPVEAVSK